MSVACRDESDVQLAGSDRGLTGGADVTASEVLCPGIDRFSA
jgi:hypothetical protein